MATAIEGFRLMEQINADIGHLRRQEAEMLIVRAIHIPDGDWFRAQGEIAARLATNLNLMADVLDKEKQST